MDHLNNPKTAVIARLLFALILVAVEGRGQSTYLPYAFTNFAGVPGGPGRADGPASFARFETPYAIAVDVSNNVFVADTGNSTVRRITPDGTVSTLAGSPGQAANIDGAGSAARFSFPRGLAVDNAGNLFVSDTGNAAIRKVTPAGEVTTVATFTNGSFETITGIAVDTLGNLYIADTANHAVRMIAPDGSSRLLGSGFNGPTAVAVDQARVVYVSDFWRGTIERITPDGTMTIVAALVGQPAGLSVDNLGDLYFADGSAHTINKITLATGFQETLAGSPGNAGDEDGVGAAARFGSGGIGPAADRGPYGLAVDKSGTVYVADTFNHTIRRVTPNGTVTTLAGSAGYGVADGTAGTARFHFPLGVALSQGGGVFVGDFYNFTVRFISPTGLVTTLAGSPGKPGTNDGSGSLASFGRFLYAPSGILVHLGVGGLAQSADGSLFAADTGNDSIRKITPNGTVTTVLTNILAEPYGLALDSFGTLYVADSQNQVIRRITATGTSSILAGSLGNPGSDDGSGTGARFDMPRGVAAGADGTIYVADALNATIRRISAEGSVSTLAGSPGQFGSADGTGRAARFNLPGGIAIDAGGILYVADSGNHLIRRITPDGRVVTLAGSALIYGSNDGVGPSAQFDNPFAIVVDPVGSLYVADTYNNRITKGTAMLQFDGGTSGVSLADGRFHSRLVGPYGVPALVEVSTDLRTWSTSGTYTVIPAGVDVSVPLSSGGSRFFRARLIQ